MARKHESVRAYLLTAIRDELGPDARLPSEREIADRLGVSRPTVRRALDRMAAEGRVRRVHGAGTFVSAVPAADRDERTSAGVLAARETVAAPRQAWRLGIPRGEPLWHVERLLLADGLPLALESAYVVKALAPGLLRHRLDRPLRELLAEHYAIALVRTSQSVTATLLESPTAELLGVPALSPALAVERVSWDERGRSVELTRSLRPGDRGELRWNDERRHVDRA